MPKYDPESSATPEQAPDMGEDMAKDITLDLSDDQVASQFADCEVGETLTVKSKDENTIVLSKEGYGDEESGETTADDESAESDGEMGGMDTTGVDELIRRKRKAA